jgi:hypothetical protein
MKDKLSNVKNFVHKNRTVIAVSAISAAAIIPLAWLAKTGMEYAMEANKFIDYYELTSEWQEHIWLKDHEK